MPEAAPPLRVAHCIHGLGVGGAQKVIAAIVGRRKEGGNRYYVYSSSDGALRTELEAAGGRVRILERRLPRLDPLWLRKLARAMREDRIDCVHTHLFGDALHGWLAARHANGLPVVTTLHIGDEGLPPLQRLGYRFLLPRCDRVVACSHAVALSFRERGSYRGPIDVVPNGLAWEEDRAADVQRVREQLGIARQERVVAAFGRLAPQKGYDVLLRAFAGLDETRARLVLIGEGPEQGRLQSLSQALQLGDRVLFTGFRNDLKRLLPACEVVVFSSRFEGLPIALLEAMAAARCLVVTDCPGMLEAVRANREALVAQRENVEELRTAIEAALRSPDLRTRLGGAARTRFLSEYQATKMVERYERLYRELVGGAPPPTETPETS